MAFKQLAFAFYALGVIGLFIIGIDAVTVDCGVMSLTNLLAIVGLGLYVFGGGQSKE